MTLLDLDALRHRAVRDELSTGASRSTERIAFTPTPAGHSRSPTGATRDDTQPDIGCDHLLLALVDLGQGVAAGLLSAAGLALPTSFESRDRTARSGAEEGR